LSSARRATLDEEATAEPFGALSDPARVRMVNLLATSGGPVCACELYEPLGLARPEEAPPSRRLLAQSVVTASA
jgi:DNA-binding transcriptional ArsR family regulator